MQHRAVVLIDIDVPLAQVEEGTFVILYAPEGPVFDNCKEMLAKLDDIGAEVVLVSDNEELVSGRPCALCDTCLKRILPEGNALYA